MCTSFLSKLYVLSTCICLIWLSLAPYPKYILGQVLETDSPCNTSQAVSLKGSINQGCGKIENLTMEIITKNMFVWNKSSVSRDQYQMRFCGDTCGGQDIHRPHVPLCSAVQCFRCSCEKPACNVYGTCCPTGTGEKQEENEVNNPQVKTNTKLMHDQLEIPDANMANPLDFPVLKCEPYETGGHLLIHSCPSSFQDSRAKRLCEQNLDQIPVEDMTLDLFAKVGDTMTNVTYHNKYCALCNGVPESQIVSWKVDVRCVHLLYMYGATTTDEYLSFSLRPNSTCDVKQKPQGELFTPCSLKWFSEDIIDSCNVTGLWRVYDQDVENSCLEMSRPSFQVYAKAKITSQPKLFKNIFCALCNVEDKPVCKRPPLDRPKFPLGKLEVVDQMPFRLILGFRRHRQPNFENNPALSFSTCETGEWASPDGLCRQLHCSRGKVPENGTCVTALGNIRGLGYQLSLWFESDWSRAQNSTELFRSSERYMAHVNKSLTDKVKLNLQEQKASYKMLLKGVIINQEETTYSSSNANDGYQQDIKFWLQVQIAASEDILRDEFEAQLSALLENLTWYPLDIGANVRLVPILAPRETTANQLCSVPNVKCVDFVSSFAVNRSSGLFTASADFLNTRQNFSCQHVLFDESQYRVDEFEETAHPLPRAKVTLDLGFLTLDFIENNELTSIFIDKENMLHACRDILDSKLKLLRLEKTHLNSVQKAQYYLTLICLIISMVCLLITLFTYLSFAVLRNQAGLNNVFLCGSLLMAQAFLLISAHVSGPHTLCTAVGMLTHFLWLWMFVWSFICCFHMFRVFTVKTVGHTTRATCCCGPNSSLLHSVAMSLVCPAAVVSLVVVISLATSGGTWTGYGKVFCSLDSNILVGVATVLPLVVVTVCNIVFYSITAGKIYETGQMQSRDFAKKSDRTNFYIYIKLSTITGAFWLLQILAEALSNDVLWIIAIITNGLQGLFIFVSYMCNKRVLHLYRDSIRERFPSTGTPQKSTAELVEVQSSSGSNPKEQPASADTLSTSDKIHNRTE